MPVFTTSLAKLLLIYEFLAFSKLIGILQQRKVGWLAHQASKSHVDFVPISKVVQDIILLYKECS